MTPQLGASLTDDSRSIIYNRNMFKVQATGLVTLNSSATDFLVFFLLFWIRKVFLKKFRQQNSSDFFFSGLKIFSFMLRRRLFWLWLVLPPGHGKEKQSERCNDIRQNGIRQNDTQKYNTPLALRYGLNDALN